MSSKETVVYGWHAVHALLQQRPEKIRQLLLQAERQDAAIQEAVKLAEMAGVTVQTVPKARLDQLTQGAVHQGVAAMCVASRQYSERDLPHLIHTEQQSALLLVLDGVQDPHNLGACLRTANALGAQAVIVPKDRAVGLTPVVRKVASGAAEITPLVSVTNLARTLNWLKEQGIWLYGADEAGTQAIHQVDFTSSTALVLGAEGKGLRRLTRECCDVVVKIPTAGFITSLNVAVATGICLFEVMRQRAPALP